MQEYTDWKTNTNTHQEEIWEWEGRHCIESWESHFVLFVRNMYGWGGRDCQNKNKKVENNYKYQWTKTNTTTEIQTQIQMEMGSVYFLSPTQQLNSSFQETASFFNTNSDKDGLGSLSSFGPPKWRQGFQCQILPSRFFQKEELFACCNGFL